MSVILDDINLLSVCQVAQKFELCKDGIFEPWFWIWVFFQVCLKLVVNITIFAGEHKKSMALRKF
jgi:hypothetical protein